MMMMMMIKKLYRSLSVRNGASFCYGWKIWSPDMKSAAYEYTEQVVADSR
jgi:hypothetical protein